MTGKGGDIYGDKEGLDERRKDQAGVFPIEAHFQRLTSKFIYRIATILSVNNTCFIVPIEDEFGGLIGYYPLLPQRCEVIEYNNVPFLRYTFGNGQKAAIEFERVGVMTNFQYTNDFFGESNAALRPTMQLIHTQNQGIINGVKNSASIRFLAKVANMLKPEDITKERKRFTADNLSAENQSGMVIYDAKFADVKPIESKPFTVNAAQMAQINENVFNYFGTNAGILQNKYTEDEWNAYYEGKIEPFAIQLSLVMSNMTYTARELSFGNAITFTAKAWINGYFYFNTGDLAVELDTADGQLNRVDRVVVRWDLTNRVMSVKVKSSSFSASPTAPALQRDADIYELALADIYVGAGVTAITQSKITDQRLNTSLCGVVAAVVQQIDTAAFNAQLQAWFAEYQSLSAAEYNTLVSYMNSLKLQRMEQLQRIRRVGGLPCYA